jgi:hypothetical protein
MTKDDFVLHIKRAAALFQSDEPSPATDDLPVGGWVERWGTWKAAKAKLEVDTKRAAKVRATAADLRARAEAAGLALVTHEEAVEQYDTAMSKLEAEVERLRAEVEKLRGE